MNRSVFCLILCILLYASVSAQIEKDSLVVDLHFKWKSEILELNKNYNSTNDTLQISLLKFYISRIQVNYSDGSIYNEKNGYHLIDIENFKPFAISKKENKTVSNLVFNVGIDSIASVSGALSGALDLQNGMYWAWQSGYINIKIEGTSKSCKTRNNAFQFHIGGYLNPNYAIRTVNVKCNCTNKIDLGMDLSKLFEEINLSETNSIMIPGKHAMKIADLSTKMFFIE